MRYLIAFAAVLRCGLVLLSREVHAPAALPADAHNVYRFNRP